MTAKFDPLEAVKLNKKQKAPAATPAAVLADADSSPAEKQRAANAELVATQQPTPALQEHPSPPKPEPEAVLPAELPVEKAKVSGRYRVKQTRTISWLGQINTLHAGSIVTFEGYGGQAGIDRLLSSGVVLEAID